MTVEYFCPDICWWLGFGRLRPLSQLAAAFQHDRVGLSSSRKNILNHCRVASKRESAELDEYNITEASPHKKCARLCWSKTSDAGTSRGLPDGTNKKDIKAEFRGKSCKVTSEQRELRSTRCRELLFASTLCSRIFSSRRQPRVFESSLCLSVLFNAALFRILIVAKSSTVSSANNIMIAAKVLVKGELLFGGGLGLS